MSTPTAKDIAVEETTSELFKQAECRVAAYCSLEPEHGRALYAGYVKRGLVIDALKSQLATSQARCGILDKTAEECCKYEQALFNIAYPQKTCVGECKCYDINHVKSVAIKALSIEKEKQ